MLNISRASSIFLYEWPVLQMCCGYSVCPNKLCKVCTDHQIICCWLGTFTCLATHEWNICKQGIFLKSIPYKAHQTLQQTDHKWYTAHYSLLHLNNIFHICPAGRKPRCMWDIDEIWFQKPFIKYVTKFGNKYALCENQNTLIYLLFQNMLFTQ